MPRTLTAGMQAAVAAESSTVLHLLEFQFGGGTVRYNTGAHPLSWNGQTWEGVGGIFTISPIAERGEVVAATVTVTLSGVDQAIISVLLSDTYLGRPYQIYRAHLSASGTIVADPVLLSKGRMNGGFEVTEARGEDFAPGTVTVRARLVDLLADLEQVRGMLTNLDTHQAIFAGDRFFQHAAGLVNKRISWGT